jgi:hypothetical protein
MQAPQQLLETQPMITNPLATVAAADWRIADSVCAVRRHRLLEGAPSPEDLITIFAEAAMDEAMARSVGVSWCEAGDVPGYSRVEATICLTAEHFDWLFNGRTGYRAAYWLSVQDGRRFNDLLLQAIEPTFEVAWSVAERPVPWDHARRSLLGGDSKLWAPERKLLAPDECEDWGDYDRLVPKRWCESRWNDGTRLPLPCPPRIEVKGTFIDSVGCTWLSPNKACRHEWLHKTGFT